MVCQTTWAKLNNNNKILMGNCNLLTQMMTNQKNISYASVLWAVIKHSTQVDPKLIRQF